MPVTLNNNFSAGNPYYNPVLLNVKKTDAKYKVPKVSSLPPVNKVNPPNRDSKIKLMGLASLGLIGITACFYSGYAYSQHQLAVQAAAEAATKAAAELAAKTAAEAAAKIAAETVAKENYVNNNHLSVKPYELMKLGETCEELQRPTEALQFYLKIHKHTLISTQKLKDDSQALKAAQKVITQYGLQSELLQEAQENFDSQIKIAINQCTEKTYALNRCLELAKFYEANGQKEKALEFYLQGSQYVISELGTATNSLFRAKEIAQELGKPSAILQPSVEVINERYKLTRNTQELLLGTVEEFCAMDREKENSIFIKLMKINFS